MDNIKFNLTYVLNHCPNIVLESDDIKMILNGEYKKIVENYKAEELIFNQIESERITEVDISDRPEDEKVIIPTNSELNFPKDEIQLNESGEWN